MPSVRVDVEERSAARGGVAEARRGAARRSSSVRPMSATVRLDRGPRSAAPARSARGRAAPGSARRRRPPPRSPPSARRRTEFLIVFADDVLSSRAGERLVRGDGRSARASGRPFAAGARRRAKVWSRSMLCGRSRSCGGEGSGRSKKVQAGQNFADQPLAIAFDRVRGCGCDWPPGRSPAPALSRRRRPFPVLDCVQQLAYSLLHLAQIR